MIAHIIFSVYICYGDTNTQKSPLLQSTNQGAVMKTISVKAIGDGTLRVLYDPNINKYTIHCVDDKGNAVSHPELSKEQALELLKEKTSAQIDPMVAVV